jgi:hypothetical protein
MQYEASSTLISTLLSHSTPNYQTAGSGNFILFLVSNHSFLVYLTLSIPYLTVLKDWMISE